MKNFAEFHKKIRARDLQNKLKMPKTTINLNNFLPYIMSELQEGTQQVTK
jgi:hypothetical protein